VQDALVLRTASPLQSLEGGIGNAELVGCLGLAKPPPPALSTQALPRVAAPAKGSYPRKATIRGMYETFGSSLPVSQAVTVLLLTPRMAATSP
jgi:hypothetical protein